MKRRLFILFLIAIPFFLFFVALFLSNTTDQQNSEPLPTEREQLIRARRERIAERKPLPITALPTLPTTNGGAIDTSSTIVKASGEELVSIYPLLPYSQELTLATGIRVSILIPGAEFQDDSWKLTVNIFGINYNVLPEEKNYDQMRESFLEATDHVLSWLTKNGVDTQKVIIKWGDRAFIQERATEWLSE